MSTASSPRLLPAASSSWLVPIAVFATAVAPARAQAKAQASSTEPVVYSIGAIDTEARTATVVAVLPTGGADVVELFLPRWSPGFYRVEDYREKVAAFAVADTDGAPIAGVEADGNRWRVPAHGRAQIVATYTLRCDRGSVTHDEVTGDYAVFCGPATFVAMAGDLGRPRAVHLDVPAGWDVATALRPDAGATHAFTAPDYDTLVDAPIVAGALRRQPFTVLGQPHEWVDFGRFQGFDQQVAVLAVEPIAAEVCSMFGDRPFERYVFLCGFRRANGGLEHLNSTLLSAQTGTPPDDGRWLSFVAHEYAHAFNVKRLRPVELGPFDYEAPPRTESLWISEGLTTWCGDLAVARAGRLTPAQYLAALSQHIRTLHGTPGRRMQTLADASLQVWQQSTSGVGGDPRKTVSYYTKGPVVGFVLDAEIRRRTDGKKGLDDALALAYRRWSGARGFRPAEFEAAASEVAGGDLTAWFDRAVRSTEELDYEPALQWFGLRFRPDGDADDGGGDAAAQRRRFVLEVHPEASAEQQRHFADLLRARRGS